MSNLPPRLPLPSSGTQPFLNVGDFDFLHDDLRKHLRVSDEESTSSSSESEEGPPSPRTPHPPGKYTEEERPEQVSRIGSRMRPPPRATAEPAPADPQGQVRKEASLPEQVPSSTSAVAAPSQPPPIPLQQTPLAASASSQHVSFALPNSVPPLPAVQQFPPQSSAPPMPSQPQSAAGVPQQQAPLPPLHSAAWQWENVSAQQPVQGSTPSGPVQYAPHSNPPFPAPQTVQYHQVSPPQFQGLPSQAAPPQGPLASHYEAQLPQSQQYPQWGHPARVAQEMSSGYQMPVAAQAQFPPSASAGPQQSFNYNFRYKTAEPSTGYTANVQADASAPSQPVNATPSAPAGHDDSKAAKGKGAKGKKGDGWDLFEGCKPSSSPVQTDNPTITTYKFVRNWSTHDGETVWYASKSDTALPHPPTLLERDIKPGDLYVHLRPGPVRTCWMYDHGKWKDITAGAQVARTIRHPNKDVKRGLHFTPIGGYPSWIQ